MFEKILVAVDLSGTSQQVFQEACTIAQASGGQLLLLNVLTPLGDSAPPILALGVDGMYPGIHAEALKHYMVQLEQTEKQGLSYLRSLQAQAVSLNLNTEISQKVGDPGSRICETARTWGADLVVLGRRGLSGLSELFLGSVSNYVLHRADCSVLTVQDHRMANAITSSESEVAITH